MGFLRRIVIRAVQKLGQNPEARAKASQVLEKDAKPLARQAWRSAQPKIEDAKIGLLRYAHRVREEFRKGREGE